MYCFVLRRGSRWISRLCKYTQCGPYQVLLLYHLIYASVHIGSLQNRTISPGFSLIVETLLGGNRCCRVYNTPLSIKSTFNSQWLSLYSRTCTYCYKSNQSSSNNLKEKTQHRNKKKRPQKYQNKAEWLFQSMCGIKIGLYWAHLKLPQVIWN